VKAVTPSLSHPKMENFLPSRTFKQLLSFRLNEQPVSHRLDQRAKDRLAINSFVDLVREHRCTKIACQSQAKQKHAFATQTPSLSYQAFPVDLGAARLKQA
jgi:hypothetical protein